MSPINAARRASRWSALQSKADRGITDTEVLLDRINDQRDDSTVQKRIDIQQRQDRDYIP
jgi:hypothetical protein